MVKAKMMNENSFDKLVKEMNALAELIKSRQDEKQAVLDEFDKEKARYSKGKISQATLASSIRKTNAELIRLDKNIRLTMVKSKKLLSRMSDFVTAQAPKVFRAKESGFSLASGGAKKKKVAKKKVVKKKGKMTAAQIKTEMKAEKKFRR